MHLLRLILTRTQILELKVRNMSIYFLKSRKTLLDIWLYEMLPHVAAKTRQSIQRGSQFSKGRENEVVFQDVLRELDHDEEKISTYHNH